MKHPNARFHLATLHECRSSGPLSSFSFGDVSNYIGQYIFARWNKNIIMFLLFWQNNVGIEWESVKPLSKSHIRIRSLHYFAKREGTLLCSYSTWRKYIDQYSWKRPRKKKRKEGRKIGIRAKWPNEIWHLDVSYFILPDGTKCFIQAIIDNYSRYVLAWQVLKSYDGAKTASLLEEAIRKSAKIKSQASNLELIVDGGGENKGQGVKKLENQGHFKKLVARFEISFSNSMVEALFRSLKNNYLYHQKIRTVKALSKCTSFWFNDYNERIPH